MLKFRSAIIVITLGLSSAGAAQTLTAEQLAACKPDFDKYCGGRVPDGNNRVIGCFMTGPPSDACKRAMNDSEQKRLDAAKKQ
jgi:hypothetical protein